MKMTTHRTMNRFAAVLTIFLALLSGAACQEIRTVNVTVVEEDGTPVVGAGVSIWFLGYSGAEDKQSKGTTDVRGGYSARDHAPLRMSVSVEKEGYYKSYIGRLSRKEDHNLRVVLRRKINPIPLYAKKLFLKIPKLGEPCGFDFSAGDWVAPHGTGNKADIFFNHTEKTVWSRDHYKSTLKITFPNELDGVLVDGGWIQSSEFRSSRLAPTDGYHAQETIIDEQGESGEYRNSPLQNYILRVRSEKSKDGELPKACYVKIIGGVDLLVGTRYPERPGAIRMVYYFNPNANDRNLEFDPSQNLFEDLEPEEMVREP